MPKKQPSNSPKRDMFAYIIQSPAGDIEQVYAGNTASLKTHLARLLDLPPYSLQAIAYLASVDRATVTGKAGWSVGWRGRVVVLDDDATPAPKGVRKAAPQPQVTPPASLSAHPKGESEPAGEQAQSEATVLGEVVDELGPVLDRLGAVPGDRVDEEHLT